MVKETKMNSLYNTYNVDVFGTYIIYIPGHELSEKMARRCLQSCESVGQKAELFEGFDGTSGVVKIPKHLEDQSWVKWMKVTDQFQSPTEIACSLSHIALWVKCMEIGLPVVILEHDAIMVKPYHTHPFYNILSYLGCHEQLQQQCLPITPIHSSINKNWHFINRAHAYCVDPQVSKRLFINVLDRGIFETSDVMIKCDDVGIVQHDFYAYDKSDGFSTLHHKESGDHRKLKQTNPNEIFMTGGKNE
jgi:hypothetical protein